MLTTGTKAPDFMLPDQNGQAHSLSDYAGKTVLLYFYPKDNTAGCSKQAEAYSEKAEAFAAQGVTILGVSKDSAASHKKFEANHQLKLTLLSDTERTAIQAYDIWKEKKMCGKVSEGVVRTTYVINGDGVIVFANDKVKAAEDAERMLAYVTADGAEK